MCLGFSKPDERLAGYILRHEGRDELGELLAKHPRAAARTKRLAAELTGTKLVRVANPDYNYCRLGRDIPSDLKVVARTEMAWSILDVKIRTLKMRPGTAWTRTIDLVSSEGSDEALARARDLPMDRFMIACDRLIKGSCTALTKSGGVTRW